MVYSICVCSDLSQGAESKKLPAILINEYMAKIKGKREPKPFQYISQMELSKELEGNFDKQKENIQQSTADIEFQVFNNAKGWALRTLEAIEKPNIILFEYAGMLLLDLEQIAEDDYILSFIYNGARYLLDANKKGNMARFCNHSCDPNCIAQMAVNEKGGPPRVLISTKRPIKQDEELTLDYGRKWWMAKFDLDCACGSTECKYTGIRGQDARIQFRTLYHMRQTAKKSTSCRAPARARQTAYKVAHNPNPTTMATEKYGRPRQLATKRCGRIQFPPTQMATKVVFSHPTMKVEGGGNDEEAEDDDVHMEVDEEAAEDENE